MMKFWICDVCGKKFNKPKSMTNHRRWHNEEFALKLKKSFSITPRAKGKHWKLLEKTKEKQSLAKLWTKNPNWKHGLNGYRRRAFETFGIKCKKCKVTDIKLLLVHHKNHNRFDNRLTNLEILCRNCHWLEHHKR